MAPDRLRGYERLDGTAAQQLMDSVMSETMASSGATSFGYVYAKTGGMPAGAWPSVIAVRSIGTFPEPPGCRILCTGGAVGAGRT